MEEIIKKLEKTIEQNDKCCARILAGEIYESDSVYMPELPGDAREKCLNKRETYIYHRAFNDGVKTALAVIKQALEADDKNLLEDLFEQK